MAVAGEHSLQLTGEDLQSREHCPICGETGSQAFSQQSFGEATIRHVHCRGCGLVRMEPVPTQEWYNKLYGEEFWEAKSIKAPKGDIWANYKQWHKGLARAEKYLDLLRGLGRPLLLRSVLEIGASFGTIGTAVAREFGAQAYGVEPNHAARDFASKVSGMKMVAETADGLKDWTPDAPVDLVIFSHVLENILDLDSTLASVHKKMAPGAVLLIETPNVNWQPSMSIYHPYCFTAEALRLLLARNGYRVLSATYTGRPASIQIPRYLTILAEAGPSPLIDPPATNKQSALRVKFRHFIYKIYYSSICGHYDMKKSWKQFHQTKFVMDGVQGIRDQLKHLGKLVDQD